MLEKIKPAPDRYWMLQSQLPEATSKQGSGHRRGRYLAVEGCAIGTRSYDIELFHFRRWIKDVLNDFPAPLAKADLRRPRQRKCRYYGFAPEASEDITITGAGDRLMRVSLNCQSTGRPISLCLAQKTDSPTPGSCVKRVGAGVSQEVAVHKGQSWSITFDGGGAPGCQLVATTHE